MTLQLSAGARRRPAAFAALVGVLAFALVWAGPGSRAGAADDEAEPKCESAPSGYAQTFEYTGKVQTFKVPAGIHSILIQAEGGHGGQDDRTAPGGRGGGVEAGLDVTPGECLHVYVGGYGHYGGGWGYAHGGAHGTAVGGSSGHSAGGGGGASALVRGSTALLAAGGGGGGGGDSGDDGNYGGAGGDGGTNGPGFNGSRARGKGGGAGGEGGGYFDGETNPGNHGESGQNVGSADLGGGAGGGGGGGLSPNEPGYHGGAGAGGHHGLGPNIDPPGGEEGEDDHAYGGGGGGGGGSIASSATKNARFYASPRACPSGKTPKTCNGQVLIQWDTGPQHITAVSGAGQQVVLEEEFPRPLTARVTDIAGRPLNNALVLFSTPQTGTWGEFGEGDTRTQYRRTNAEGIATSGDLWSGKQGGRWTATASLAGIQTRALFHLTNLPVHPVIDLASSANPAVAGEPVRFHAVMHGHMTPTGDVQFLVDGVELGLPPLLVDGRAQSPPVVLGPGDHQVEVTYAANYDFEAASAELTQKVAKATSAVKVSSSANPAELAAPVSFTATVSKEAASTATPTGTVQFAVDGVDRGAPVPLSAGTATLAGVADLPVGEHEVSATYSGDANFEAATGTVRQAIGPDRTAIDLAAEPSPAVHGEATEIVAHVSSSGPEVATGSITLGIDGGPTCGAVPLDAIGSARCTLDAAVAAGSHVVRASYPGDAELQPSEGAASLEVTPARTAITVTAEPDPSNFGTAVELSADVEVEAPGGGSPAGTVQFELDGAAVGEPVTVEEGRASGPQLTSLQPGTHTVRAAYSGAADFKPASDGAVATVLPAPVTVELTASANPVTPSEAVTVGARVEAGPLGPAPGSVQFTVDGLDHGAPVPVIGGLASLPPLTGLAPGAHEIRAYYAGSSDYRAAKAELGLLVAEPAVGAPPRAFLASRREPVTSKGRTRIQVACTGAAGAGCDGVLRLSAKRRSLGSARFSLPTGSTGSVMVRLSKAGARAVSAAPHLRVSAALNAGPGSVAGGSLVLTAARAPAAAVVGPAAFHAGRILRIPLLCRAPRSGRCEGRLTLVGPTGPLGRRATISIRGGRRSVVDVPLSAPARRDLAAAGRLAVEARVVTEIPVGLSRETTRKLALRSP